MPARPRRSTLSAAQSLPGWLGLLGMAMAMATSSVTSACAEDTAPWTDALERIDPTAPVAGRWTREDGALRCDAAAGARIEIGPPPADEYDLRVRFTRRTGHHSVALLLVVGQAQVGIDLDGWGSHLAGFQDVDGQDMRDNGTAVEGVALENDTAYTAIVQVRREHVRFGLQDRWLGTLTTEDRTLALHPIWQLPRSGVLGVGAYDSEVVFHAIEMRPASDASPTPAEATSEPAASIADTPDSTETRAMRPAEDEPPGADDAQAPSEWSDEFDDPDSLANWRRVFEVEGTGADQLERLDIGRTRDGCLTMIPFTSSWYQDWRGVLMFRSIEGDFLVRTRVRTTGRDGRSAPPSPFSLAGIMVRAPREVTPRTVAPGGENYLFLSHGSADRPGSFQFEVKTTENSRSQLQVTESIGPEAEIAVLRMGDAFVMLRRQGAGDWEVHRRFRRPDMPRSLQVGMTCYTDWPNVQRLQPAVHNRTVVRDGDPDLIASFEYWRVTRPAWPEDYRGQDVSDPRIVPDEILVALLGE